MKSLLCDAVIVIDAHTLELWKTLKSHYKIHIASTVMRESQFFKNDLQIKHYLDFKRDISNHTIVKISLSIDEIKKVIERALASKCDIQAGEAESIAALLRPEYQQLYFCTADRIAVAATHLFKVIPRVVSLENCLEKIKHCKLPYKLTETTMQHWKAEAIQRAS